MPGTINAVKVTAGESIKKGQVVAVLEAMKMENEIEAEGNHVVKRVLVKPGDVVASDQAIIEYES